jgi:hypothetical protein
VCGGAGIARRWMAMRRTVSALPASALRSVRTVLRTGSYPCSSA